MKSKPFLAVILVGMTLMAGGLKGWAVSILSGPYFTPATNAPLAGLLQVTTDVDSRISVLISDGMNYWEKDFYDYSTNHALALVGFKPNETNQMLVIAYDKDRNEADAQQLLTFITPPLPANFPTYTVLTNQPDQMEPGYFLLVIHRAYQIVGNYIAILDNSGNVVWYSPVPATSSGSGDYNDVRQLDNGDLFLQLPQPSNEFIEINMLGQIVRTWQPPARYPINDHEGIVTSHGTILYLSDATEVVPNFPTSDTNPNAPLITTNMDYNPVVEISITNSELVNTWSTLDMLDPSRVTYLTYGEYSGATSYGIDNEHANALIDDTNDNSILVSSRVQNAIFKFSRSTGTPLKWILADHALWGTKWQPYLLNPVGTPFNWCYGQHAPTLTPQGTLLVYNDNPYQASPYNSQVTDQNNSSSAVEYSINETNMTVSEVWNSAWQTNQDRLYTPIVGRVQWLPKTRNIFVGYGFITYINGVAPGGERARLVEYTHDPVPQVVFDLSFAYDGTANSYSGGYYFYRAYQIPHLYAHSAEPVTDLTVHDDSETPILEFSADPTHNYEIQASTDLTHWAEVGPALQVGAAGEFDFYDLNSSQFKSRFYRVVTY